MIFFKEYGIASVQAAADILSLALAIPICLYMLRKIRRAMTAEADSDICNA